MRSAGLLFGRRRRSSKAAENSSAVDRAIRKAQQSLHKVAGSSPRLPPHNLVVQVENKIEVVKAQTEIEDDFFFLFDDEEDYPVDDKDHGAHYYASLKAIKGARSHGGSSLMAAQPEEMARNVAVEFLEDFFFGDSSSPNSSRKSHLTTPSNSNAKQQRNSSCESSSMDFIDDSLLNSTTSTIIPGDLPVCSFTSESRMAFSGHSKVQSFHNQQKQPALSNLSDGRCLSMPAIARLSSSNSVCSFNGSARPRKSVLKQQQSEPNLTSSKLDRSVSFTDISVREYDVELSDHPSCSYGPPIQLGWDYLEEMTTSVENYEVTRNPQRRRDVHELVLSYNARKRRLKQSGYNRDDIKAVEKEVDRVKRERLITAFFLPASAIDETVERMFLFLKDVFVRPFQQQPATVCRLH